MHLKTSALILSALEVPLIKHPVVYFLLHKNVIVYVGQSTQLHCSIDRHLRERFPKRTRPAPSYGRYRKYARKVFDRVVFYPVPKRRLDAVEQACITYFDPKYNTTRYHRKVDPKRAALVVGKLLKRVP
jgi:hypothetical protein